jgi:predicted PurR-regulated permease PerM
LDLPTTLVALIAVAVIAYMVTVVYAATMKTLARRGETERPEEGLISWPKWLSGLVAGLLVLWLLYRVRAILLPFVVGAVIAYLLNPSIDRLERRGWERTHSIALVFGIFLLVFVIGALLVIPTLAAEAEDLSFRYDSYVRQVSDLIAQVEKTAELWGGRLGLMPSGVNPFGELAQRAQTYALALLTRSLGWLNRSLVVVSLLIITPIVAFWLLRDYHHLGRSLMRSLPERQRAHVLAVLHDLNQVAGGYLLGMATMAVLVGVFAVIVFSVAGVPFSVLLGIMTGVLSMVAYVGYPTALVITVLVMLTSGKSLGVILTVVAVMVAGNAVFDYVVSPRVLGRRVGLHPLVVIFAILAGGTLFGFLGVVLAVPLAGAIKVVSLHFWPELYPTDSADQAPA